MSVRAKFRCNEILLRESQSQREDIEYLRYADEKDGHGHWVNKETGEDHTGPTYITWNKPTVRMVTVTSGTPENEIFYEASPSGTFEIIIKNPSAAEYFQVGKEYYFDISEAD